MVKPLLGTIVTPTALPTSPPKSTGADAAANGKVGGDGGGGDDDLPPGIRAFLILLPHAGTILTPQNRTALVSLFDAAIQASYSG